MEKIKHMLINYDSKVKSNYKTLKQAFLKIYGKKKKTAHEHQADFLMTTQNEMNLYYFHAELCRLAKKAFPDLSENQRKQQVHDKFINGINSDMLRSSILASYKEDGIFSSIYGGKSLLDRAVELEEIYDRKQVEINFIQGVTPRRADQNTCYNCLQKGHFKSDCKNPKVSHNYNSNLNQKNINKQNTNNTTNDAVTNNFSCNRIEYTNSITGNCALDGKQTRFLMDTGANKTVIDVRLLNDEQKDEIVPSPFRVILADGSRVPVLGLRKSNIQLGRHSVNLNVLVTENLHEGCLLGRDFLQICPSTRELIQ